MSITIDTIYAANNTQGSSPAVERAGKTPIKNIVVIIQGEHSFDGYFGTFPFADGFPANLSIPSNPFANNSEFIKPFHIENLRNYDPNEDPDRYFEAYNNGSMNGFVYAQRKANEPNDGSKNVMGYYDYRELPYYWKFASDYVLAEKFFSPSMRSGLVNALYAIAADPSDYKERVPKGGLEINNTIFDELEKINLPWKIYVENHDAMESWSEREKRRLAGHIPVLGISRFTPNGSLGSHISDLSNYYTDIRNERFPAVSYIYFTESNDDELKEARSGEEYVTNLVYSLMKSQYWNTSAIIITWNEAGGWYDHVKPPLITNEQNGFRVPAIIISSYAKNGYIDNHTYDVTSILKFIEYTFGMASLADRDNKTENIVHAFDFTKLPQKPIYLDAIVSYSPLINSSNVYGIKMIYFLSFLVPILITSIWYYKKRSSAKNKSESP